MPTQSNVDRETGARWLRRHLEWERTMQECAERSVERVPVPDTVGHQRHAAVPLPAAGAPAGVALA